MLRAQGEVPKEVPIERYAMDGRLAGPKADRSLGINRPVAIRLLNAKAQSRQRTQRAKQSCCPLAGRADPNRAASFGDSDRGGGQLAGRFERRCADEVAQPLKTLAAGHAFQDRFFFGG